VGVCRSGARTSTGGPRTRAPAGATVRRVCVLSPQTSALIVGCYRAGQGVCRDFAHLAITFSRALNIPARYVFGYIPEIDAPPPAEPMEFAAWFEVHLDGAWHTFDARNNRVRTGRVVVGRGRDAVDVALITSFGAVTLTEFAVRAVLSGPRASKAGIRSENARRSAEGTTLEG
jgi:transglutaminase-like putative cysteine protease